MSLPARLKEQSGPTGLTLFGPLPETEDLYLLWLGPGARLYLGVNPFNADGALVPIEHPTANGVYLTRGEARDAANAFAREVK